MKRLLRIAPSLLVSAFFVVACDQGPSSLDDMEVQSDNEASVEGEALDLERSIAPVELEADEHRTLYRSSSAVVKNSSGKKVDASVDSDIAELVKNIEAQDELEKGLPPVEIEYLGKIAVSKKVNKEELEKLGKPQENPLPSCCSPILNRTLSEQGNVYAKRPITS